MKMRLCLTNLTTHRGRLKCHWHHQGVRSLPALYMAARGGFAFLNINAIVSPFLQECQQLPRNCDSPTAPCKRYLRGIVPPTETQRLCCRSSELPNISSCYSGNTQLKGAAYIWQSRMVPLPHKYVAVPTTTSI